MIARRERPMRREISCVRPPILPRTDSRSERLSVARGSIEYSAVTQPSPEPLRQRGTPSVNDATHSTLVLPNSTRTLPSPALRKRRVMVMGRSSSGARPSARTAAGARGGSHAQSLTSARHRPDQRSRLRARRSHRARRRRSARRTPRAPRPTAVGVGRPGRQVGQHEATGPPVGCRGARAATRQVHAPHGVVAPLDERRLGQQQVRAGRELVEPGARVGVARVRERHGPRRVLRRTGPAPGCRTRARGAARGRASAVSGPTTTGAVGSHVVEPELAADVRGRVRAGDLR